MRGRGGCRCLRYLLTLHAPLPSNRADAALDPSARFTIAKYLSLVVLYRASTLRGYSERRLCFLPLSL